MAAARVRLANRLTIPQQVEAQDFPARVGMQPLLQEIATPLARLAQMAALLVAQRKPILAVPAAAQDLSTQQT